MPAIPDTRNRVSAVVREAVPKRREAWWPAEKERSVGVVTEYGLIAACDVGPRRCWRVIAVGCLPIRRRLVKRDNVHAACAESRRPVARAGTDFDDGPECAEQRERLRIGQNVCIPLGELEARVVIR